MRRYHVSAKVNARITVVVEAEDVNRAIAEAEDSFEDESRFLDELDPEFVIDELFEVDGGGA